MLKVKVYNMKNRLIKCVVCCILLFAIGKTYAQNNPYVDDKLIHFGFFLGVDMLSYNIQENDAETQASMPKYDGNVYYPKTMSVGAGFDVGFITDLRLSRHLNLRFTPSLSFGERSVTYKCNNLADSLIGYYNDGIGNKPRILTIPVSIPLYLKWSADRHINYRPYVVVGGGVQFECFRDKEKPILHKTFDAFVSAGFGCDLYFRWFKLSPEIKYQIGFIDAHITTDKAEQEAWQLNEKTYFYSDAIKKMTHQKLSIIFNFE
jgi:hypothetical protein